MKSQKNESFKKMKSQKKNQISTKKMKSQKKSNLKKEKTISKKIEISKTMKSKKISELKHFRTQKMSRSDNVSVRQCQGHKMSGSR